MLSKLYGYLAAAGAAIIGVLVILLQRSKIKAQKEVIKSEKLNSRVTSAIANETIESEKREAANREKSAKTKSKRGRFTSSGVRDDNDL